MVNTRSNGTSGGVDVDGKIWPASKAWPAEVKKGLSFVDGWAFVQWTTAEMQAGHRGGEIELIVWYCGCEIIGASVLQFQNTVAGLNLEILAGYSIGGIVWSRRVMPKLERLARAKGCVSMTMASPRRIDKLHDGFDLAWAGYRKELA